jgi:hypothetical protein
MSDIEITEATDDQVTPDEGQVSEAVDAEVETPEAEPELFDYTEVGDKFVKLQVDGEEVLVPVKEALAGYQRQADYTRKTQELSEQRKNIEYAAALQEALQSDPQGTLQLLQQQFGQPAVSEEEDIWIDPTEKQLKELEKRLVSFEQQRAMDELSKTIDSLQSKYGDDFNADEVVAKALATGATDLEAVFKQLAFDKVYAKATEANKKLAKEQERLEAKRGAAIVSSASTSKGTTAPASAPPKTVFEAFEQAKRQLGS